MLLTVIANATNATANRSLTLVVLTKILWIGQHGLQELQRYNLYFSCWLLAISRWLCQGCLIYDLVNAAHANVLDYFEVL